MNNIWEAGSSCDDEYWKLRVEHCSGLRVSHYSQNVLVGISSTSQDIFQKDIQLVTTRAVRRAMMWPTIMILPFDFVLMLG